jgi:SAM-dependent methyltransferase
VNTDDVTARYDRAAAAYRELWAPLLLEAARRLLPELAGSDVRRVLDVGTGVAALLPELRRVFPGALVLGVDLSRGMLALAPPAERLAIMDALRLAIAPASVDRVLMSFMLHHAEDPTEVVRQAARATRAGGCVASVTWAEEFRSPATQVWAECLDDHGAEPAGAAVDARHEAVDSPEKTVAIYRAAGFASPRAWCEERRHEMKSEYLIQQRTRMGAWKPRFESLSPEAQAACVASARRRMQALGPGDFIALARVVYTIARV